MSITITIIIVSAAILILFGLAALQKKGVSFNRIVLLGLALGITFGIVTQIIWGTKNQSVLQAVDWINIVGNGYLALLQVLVTPLILISIIVCSYVNKLDTFFTSLGSIHRYESVHDYIDGYSVIFA